MTVIIRISLLKATSHSFNLWSQASSHELPSFSLSLVHVAFDFIASKMLAMIDKARQGVEETAQDRETRSAGDFRKTEKSLPTHLSSRLKIPLVDNVSSYLGGRNPLAKNVDPETEIVWLLDNTAYRPVHVYPHQPQPWQAEFVAGFFKRHVSKDGMYVSQFLCLQSGPHFALRAVS